MPTLWLLLEGAAQSHIQQAAVLSRGVCPCVAPDRSFLALKCETTHFLSMQGNVVSRALPSHSQEPSRYLGGADTPSPA